MFSSEKESLDTEVFERDSNVSKKIRRFATQQPQETKSKRIKTINPSTETLSVPTNLFSMSITCLTMVKSKLCPYSVTTVCGKILRTYLSNRWLLRRTKSTHEYISTRRLVRGGGVKEFFN